jgi:hypothetical protein
MPDVPYTIAVALFEKWIPGGGNEGRKKSGNRIVGLAS